MRLVPVGPGVGNDPGNDVLSYAWDCDNNGSYETPGQSVNCPAFPDGPANHTVGLRVCDDDTPSLCGTDTASVVVNNVPPTADAGGPYTCIEGVACSVSGSGTDVPADTLTYEWDCDYDGITFTPDFTGQAGTCTYPDGPASHTAAIRVCDEDGACTDRHRGGDREQRAADGRRRRPLHLQRRRRLLRVR